MFKLKNIYKHLPSTLAGIILGALLLLVFKEKASLSEASPVLLVVIPFLLYGKKTKEDV